MERHRKLHFLPQTESITHKEWSSLERFIDGVAGDQLKYSNFFLLYFNDDTLNLYNGYYKVDSNDEKAKIKYFNQLKILYFLKICNVMYGDAKDLFKGQLHVEHLLENFATTNFSETLKLFEEYENIFIEFLHVRLDESLELGCFDGFELAKIKSALKYFKDLRGRERINGDISLNYEKLLTLEVQDIYTFDDAREILKLSDGTHRLYCGDTLRVLSEGDHPQSYNCYELEWKNVDYNVPLLHELSNEYLELGFPVTLLAHYADEVLVKDITPLLLESAIIHNNKLHKFSHFIRGLINFTYRFTKINDDGAIIINVITREFAEYFLNCYSDEEEQFEILNFFKRYHKRLKFTNEQYTNVFNGDTFVNYFLYFIFKGVGDCGVEAVVNALLECELAQTNEVDWEEHFRLEDKLLKIIICLKEYDEAVEAGDSMPLEWLLELKELPPIVDLNNSKQYNEASKCNEKLV